MSWTEERIERLKKMWHDGATASQIADELGGVSRNAVIGKAHRLGLEQPRRRSSRAKRRKRRSQPPRRTPRLRPRPRRLKPKRPRLLRRQLHPLPRRKRRRPRLRTGPRRKCSIARSVRVASSGRVLASSRRRSRPRRRAASCPQAEPGGRRKTGLLDLNDHLQVADGPSGRARFLFLRATGQSGLPLLRQPLRRCLPGPAPTSPTRRPPPPLPFGGPRVR